MSAHAQCIRPLMMLWYVCVLLMYPIRGIEHMDFRGKMCVKKFIRKNRSFRLYRIQLLRPQLKWLWPEKKKRNEKKLSGNAHIELTNVQTIVWFRFSFIRGSHCALCVITKWTIYAFARLWTGYINSLLLACVFTMCHSCSIVIKTEKRWCPVWHWCPTKVWQRNQCNAKIDNKVNVSNVAIHV